MGTEFQDPGFETEIATLVQGVVVLEVMGALELSELAAAGFECGDEVGVREGLSGQRADFTQFFEEGDFPVISLFVLGQGGLQSIPAVVEAGAVVVDVSYMHLKVLLISSTHIIRTRNLLVNMTRESGGVLLQPS